MASLYKRRNKWHISYYHNGKRYQVNTTLNANKTNKIKALKIKKEIEEYIIQTPVYSHSSSLREMIAKFKNDCLTLKSKSHNHLFNQSIRHFLKKVDEEIKIEDISQTDIANYINSLSLKVSDETLDTYIRYLKMFFNWLVEEDYITRSPIRKKHIPKKTKKNIITFENDELFKILETAKNSDINYFKLLKLLLMTGQRPADILNLRVLNFDFENKIINISISKTGKEIKFPLYDDLLNFIDEYFQDIHKAEKSEFIFKGLTLETAGQKFRRLKNNLKIENPKKYNLKTFRKTFATNLAKSGMEKTKIAELLGHESVKTTMKYYSDVAVESLRKDLNKLLKSN